MTMSINQCAKKHQRELCRWCDKWCWLDGSKSKCEKEAGGRKCCKTKASKSKYKNYLRKNQQAEEMDV